MRPRDLNVEVPWRIENKPSNWLEKPSPLRHGVRRDLIAHPNGQASYTFARRNRCSDPQNVDVCASSESALDPRQTGVKRHKGTETTQTATAYPLNMCCGLNRSAHHFCGERSFINP